jgi:hypothetical protein
MKTPTMRHGWHPIHKLLVGRDPVAGEDLAWQPTLSRFENTPNRKELLRMTEALADRVIERHRQRLHGRARRITIDMDPTDDPTHGQQQFTFFNRHYDSYCYLPMVCFLTFNEEAEQYLVAAVLRRGNATGSLGALGILRRLIARVSDAFPKARIRVRLDGGFASPEVLDFRGLPLTPQSLDPAGPAAPVILSGADWPSEPTRVSPAGLAPFR